jgi:ABC-type Na+ efflux pump permease subunit
MSGIWVVARHDIRQMLRSRTTYWFAVVMIAASSSYFLAYNKIITGLINEGASSRTIHETTVTYLNTAVFIWPLMYCLANSLGLGATAITLEKTARNLEPLLVTPLSVQQVWIGKSLGLAVVGVVAGLADGLIVFLGTSFILVIPKTGGFVPPDAVAIATAVIIAPVLALMLVLLTTCLQLMIANPRLSNGAFLVALMGVWVGLAIVSYNVQSNVNFYTPLYLALTAAAFMASRVAARLLTAERVVLSSKG